MKRGEHELGEKYLKISIGTSYAKRQRVTRNCKLGNNIKIDIKRDGITSIYMPQTMAVPLFLQFFTHNHLTHLKMRNERNNGE